MSIKLPEDLFAVKSALSSMKFFSGHPVIHPSSKEENLVFEVLELLFDDYLYRNGMATKAPAQDEKFVIKAFGKKQRVLSWRYISNTRVEMIVEEVKE